MRSVLCLSSVRACDTSCAGARSISHDAVDFLAVRWDMSLLLLPASCLAGAQANAACEISWPFAH